MDVVKDFKRSLHFLGIRGKERKFGPALVAYFTFKAVILTNLFLFLSATWQNINDRFIAIKTLAYVIPFLVNAVCLVRYREEFLSVLDTFDMKHYNIPYRISPGRRQIFHAFQAEVGKYNTLWWNMIKAYVIFFITAPIVVVLLKVFAFSEDFQAVIKESTVVTYPLYFPDYIKEFPDTEWLLNLVVYVMGNIIESSYMFIASYVTHLVCAAPLCAMVCIEFEFKLLSQYLKEMDTFVGQYDEDYRSKDKQLKFFLNYLVQHHISNTRNVETINEGIRCYTFVLTTAASVYMCMSLYAIVQKDQIILKAQEGVFFTVWASAMFLFCNSGERVKTEGENFRDALYKCAWLEKPVWFKKSLLVIMTRTCKPIDIKPFELYCLNLNRFASIMNAAYCYYNFLSNKKRK